MTSNGALIHTECCILTFVVHCVLVVQWLIGRAFVAYFKCFGTVRAFLQTKCVILTMSATVSASVLTVLKMWSLS